MVLGPIWDQIWYDFDGFGGTVFTHVSFLSGALDPQKNLKNQKKSNPQPMFGHGGGDGPQGIWIWERKR